ncbi:MAG TPA: hypothetical protein VJ553_05600 [Candidatus Paceibacterota bacterium]|nr:MAG: hypothetical protein A2Y74_01460 [Actinobacteria bacterium RBG_13_63_9]HXK37026.1 hypothetical protein [Candidatus Paceibacterota bacterium]
MDTYTSKHFNEWLERQFCECERDEARYRMLRLFNSDPAYWQERGWSRLADESGAWACASAVAQ